MTVPFASIALRLATRAGRGGPGAGLARRLLPAALDAAQAELRAIGEPGAAETVRTACLRVAKATPRGPSPLWALLESSPRPGTALEYLRNQAITLVRHARPEELDLSEDELSRLRRAVLEDAD